ncbi:hypothetical protein HK100_002484 [Physocladia obscura]|uniref:Microtubule-associated protein Jupiter n=1 Tax=Physocladia obscura TaxID=109957 RepID=A0AAD5T1B2_9FUNG|nr:hypothetical protein HK100_002484 [Physocladia obscura]
MSISETTWRNYEAAISAGNINAVLGCFSADAPSIVCVPTGGGADGSRVSLEGFVRSFLSQRENAIIEVQTLSTVSTANQLVVESILSLVHENIIDWILPGVKPTRKRVTIPLVSVVHFSADSKIQTMHWYWDQASVLRQIGVLPNSLYCKANSSETVLPVQGPRIVDRLKEPYNFLAPVDNSQSNYEENIATAPAAESAGAANKRYNQSSDIFGEPASAKQNQQQVRPTSAASVSSILGGSSSNGADVSRPSSRAIQRPGGTASNIFSNDPGPTKTGVAINPARYTSQVNLFGSSNEQQQQQDEDRLQQKQQKQEQLESGQEGVSQQQQTNGNSADPITGSRPSSRVIHRPGGPVSDIFGTQESAQTQKLNRTLPRTIEEEENPTVVPIARRISRRDPNWSSLSEQYDAAPLPTQRQQQQHEEKAPVDPVTGTRASSRVIHRPGGPVSNIFGADDELSQAQKPPRAAPKIIEDEQPAAPVARKTNRRDPNWSSLSEVPAAAAAYDDAPLPAQQQQQHQTSAASSTYHKHNKTQWDVGNEFPVPVVKKGKGAYHNPNETQHEAAQRKASESSAIGQEYAAPERKFGRKMSSHSQDSSIFIGDGRQQDIGIASAGSVGTNGVAGGVGGMAGGRNRNALSEQPDQGRPSSKVLAPPGGRTSVIIG